VDLSVTDSNGRPVKGLHKEDLQVFEDSKPQEITFFQEYTGALPSEINQPPLTQNVFSNAPRTEPASSINILLLDALNTPLQDQSYVHRELVKWITEMPSGVKIAVFALTPQLRLVQRLTDDRKDLLEAIEERKSGAAPRASPLLLSGAEIDLDRQMIGVMKEGQATAGSIDAMRQLQSETKSAMTGERIADTLRAFQQLARYLTEFPGRKNVIWISGAFPVNMFADPSLQHSDSVAHQYEAEIRRTADLLTQARIAVYPIDSSGASIDHLYEANVGLAGVTNSRDASQYQGRELQEASVQRNTNHAAMDELADDSGGKAFYGTNALDDALSRAIHAGAVYYRLDYTPTNKKNDGGYRHIQVRLVHGDSRLAYRRGYYANVGRTSAGDSRAADNPLQLVMQPGMPNSSQIVYRMELLSSNAEFQKGATINNPNEPEPATNRINVRFAARAADIRFESSSDQIRRGRVEVMLVVYDRYGNVTNWSDQTFDLALSPDRFAAAMESGISLNLEVGSSSNGRYLRSGLYDMQSRKVGTLEVPLSVATRGSSSHASAVTGKN
jgi:VWFA-related protein